MTRMDDLLEQVARLDGGSPSEMAAALNVEPTDKTFRRALGQAVESGVFVPSGSTRDRRYRRTDLEVGVGDCPQRARGLGHVWTSWRVDEQRPCRFCGTPGRATRDASGRQVGEDGHFEASTKKRAETFAQLTAPASVRAWGKS